ncbi:MAG: mechanosensitive ion channel domain-containing protein [Bacteroidota bacterium]
MENYQDQIDQAYNLIIEYTPKLLLAIITLIIGLWIINRITRLLRKTLNKQSYDPSLIKFLMSLLSWTLKLLLFISVAGMVGIATTSFVAVLGAAGLAIGLALQGTLANFAGGALIMIFRPYRVGDLIETEGHLGVVRDTQIFTTILSSPESKTIIIPNGAISNGSIVNYTALGIIRVDLTVGISYGADIDKAKSILLELMKEDSRVLPDPAPFVGVQELGDSSVNLAVRPHCSPVDYWGVYFDTLENSKKALDANNIEIPFPQMDVHLDGKLAKMD